MSQILDLAKTALAVGALAVATSCGESATSEPPLPAFLDATRPFEIGGLFAVSGPLSAKASQLEQAAVLLENYINGDPRAYDVPVDQIPCRLSQTCGAWVGTDASGNAIRGPVRILAGDDEFDDERSVAAARQLVEEKGVPAIIGPSRSTAVEAVFNQVTGQQVVLITPTASADSISDLPDRTPAEAAGNLPGYVYRTSIPDYVEVGIGVNVAANFPEVVASQPVYTLVRAEDETDVDCTNAASATFCESTVGPGYACNPPRSVSRPERQFFRFSEDDCGGQPENFCDKLGSNSGCAEAPDDAEPRCPSGLCCGRYREQKVCTKVVAPQTALVLYEDTPVGRGALASVRESWEGAQQRFVIAAQPFDPSAIDQFGGVVTALFNDAETELAVLKGRTDGEGAPLIPANYALEDSIVFIFTGATESALLLQEWLFQKDTLPAGSDRVFFVGTDQLRSVLLLNQLPIEALRNLYLTDPYTLSDLAETFFVDMFRRRWGRDPDQFAGNAFDAGLLLVAANERAGLLRQRNGNLASTSTRVPNLGPNVGANLKESLQPVSRGCLITNVANLVNSPCPTPVAQRAAPDFHQAIASLQSGNEVNVSGVTGTLTMSPAGDRLGTILIWKIASKGSPTGFYEVGTRSPFSTGPLWKK